MRPSVPPWPPLAAGAAAVVLGLLAGLALAAAVVLGLLVGGVVTLVLLSRRPQLDRVEPTQVGEPWRQRVSAALAARNRFDRALSTARAGPLKDRMRELADRLDVAVHECWTVARRGDRLDQAIEELGLPRVRSQLELLEGGPTQTATGPTSDEERAKIGQSLRAQVESADRLVAVSRQTHDRLRLLNAQMDEAVARAIELAATGPDVTALQPVDSDIDGLVVEFRALQGALDETGRV